MSTNVFSSIEDAGDEMEDRLSRKASKACGHHRWGQDEYTEEFSVNGVQYIGTLAVVYDRHEKQTYFVDNVKFTYKAKL